MSSQMMAIQRASDGLRELVRSLLPGDEIVLTDDDEKPVARILPAARHGVGTVMAADPWAGKVKLLEDGDDVILDHFADYLP